MAESLYRRSPIGNIVKVLQARRGLLNTPQIGGQSPSVRNPCYIYITGHDKSCGGNGSMSLPRGDETIFETYYFTGGSIKPGPDLDSVEIEYAGDHGLARKISATIRCYTISDFEMVQQKFLLPGNEIDVKFGYVKSWGVPQDETKLKGFIVATFAFNTTQEGYWIATFTAVSAAQAIKNVDMQLSICNGCDGSPGGLKYFTGTEEERQEVKGIAQLIASDSQINGPNSIDDFSDGFVISKFDDFLPGTEYIKTANIVIFNGNHLRSTGGALMQWFGGLFQGTMFGNDETSKSNNQVFLTLGYVINRIINDQLLRLTTLCVANTDRKRFEKLKIEFHPIYSKCTVAGAITSADPISVLFMGDANYKNFKKEGKNFDEVCQNLSAVKCKTQLGEFADIKLHNILIHRDVVAAAMQSATKVRKSESDNTDIKDTGEEVINIIDFFEKISDHISQAVGGAISLRLVEDPDNLEKLIVVDQNSGLTDKLVCVVFDPIDGDGSTRSCTIQSNVGSEEYKAAMFVGSSKKGDPVSALKGCSTQLQQNRKMRYGEALDDAFEIVWNPGNLGKNNFNGQEINALKSAAATMYKNNPNAAINENVHYPGLSISMEIDGVWGFIPGNAISSTQVPKKWRQDYKSYFMITKVSHKFSQSDYSTGIEGILAYYPNINYVEL